LARPLKRVDLSKLTPEQRAAFIQFAKDCRTAAPHVEEMKRAAQAMFVEMVRAPRWRLHEADDKPADVDELWKQGAPEVNFVDHIETERFSDQ
jgi:hypothetical protein